MHTSRIEFASFAPEHLYGAVLLSRQAGWPHRREDWATVLALSIGFAALEGDRVAGTALVTPYGSEAATIHMVIVDTAMRGRGIGRRLMHFALLAVEGRACRLVATQEVLPLYEKLGFRIGGRISQHQGTLGRVRSGEGVEWAKPGDIAALARLDRSACGMDRAPLIALLSKQGRIAVRRHEGRPTVFAALRAFGRGEVAGPVVAATADDARARCSPSFSPPVPARSCGWTRHRPAAPRPGSPPRAWRMLAAASRCAGVAARRLTSKGASIPSHWPVRPLVEPGETACSSIPS